MASDMDDFQAVRLAREAEGYFDLGLHEEALQRAEELLGCGKLENLARAIRAESLRSLGRWEEGASAFEDILRHEPDQPYGYLGLGWCEKRAGRIDRAIASMERLLETRPNEAIALFNLACYFALAGERERSLDLLQRSIAAEGNYREMAKGEEDFRSLEDDADFRRIVSGGEPG